jgi:hypothetical protein
VHLLLFILLFFFIEKVPLPNLSMAENVTKIKEGPGALSTETDAGAPAKWEIGYWYWRGWGGRDRDPGEAEPRVDIIYAQVGEHSPGGTQHEHVRLSWPERAPKANAYVAVFRCEGSACTGERLLSDLAAAYLSLKNQVVDKGPNLVGLQIDYDCPTGGLARYGNFLRGLRAALPKKDILSVTALLDWFGCPAMASHVVPWVDEFVPQFYDVDPTRLLTVSQGIAEPIDSTRWKGVFNRYGKPYRIGIASFGRLLTIKSTKKASGKKTDGITVWSESPLEMLSRHKGAFIPQGTSPAGETIARYKGDGPASVDKNGTTKLIVPTRQSILSAYRAAREMGPLCRGVLFFRYPLGEESLVLSPSELSRIIRGEELAREVLSIESHDGLCATAVCGDLLIRPQDRFSPKDLVVTVESSKELDYFVPAGLVRSKMVGSRRIEVRVPAYAGSSRIPVGRTVSREPVVFTVEEKR